MNELQKQTIMKNKINKESELIMMKVAKIIKEIKDELKQFLTEQLRRIQEEFAVQISPCMRVSEAAIYLNVSEAIIYRMIKQGKLPAIKVENMIRVHRDDLNIILDRRNQSS